jgi:hypothetical protein
LRHARFDEKTGITQELKQQQLGLIKVDTKGMIKSALSETNPN